MLVSAYHATLSAAFTRGCAKPQERAVRSSLATESYDCMAAWHWGIGMTLCFLLLLTGLRLEGASGLRRMLPQNALGPDDSALHAMVESLERDNLQLRSQEAVQSLRLKRENDELRSRYEQLEAQLRTLRARNSGAPAQAAGVTKPARIASGWGAAIGAALGASDGGTPVAAAAPPTKAAAAAAGADAKPAEKVSDAKPVEPKAGEATTEFTQARLVGLARNKQVILTFVNRIRVDFTVSWIHHVKRLGLSNWLIGAADKGALKQLLAARTPCFDMRTDLPDDEWPWGSPSFKSLGPHKIEMIYRALLWGLEARARVGRRCRRSLHAALHAARRCSSRTSTRSCCATPSRTWRGTRRRDSSPPRTTWATPRTTRGSRATARSTRPSTSATCTSEPRRCRWWKSGGR